jgi:tetratricopeptide (TPR) repeat protein
MPTPCRRAVLATLLLATALAAAQSPSDEPKPTAQPKPDSSCDEAIKQGALALQNARYEAAIQHFKAAAALDPISNCARLYLGTAYAYQVVPNLDTPENLALANNAIEVLKKIPDGTPEYLDALKQIATAYRNTTRLDAAKETELQLLKADPNHAEANYNIGVIDWMQAYKNATRILATAYLTDDGNGNTKLNISACQELSAQNSALIQDSIDHLTRAIDLKPDYDDAMQYLNLTYRRHADFACGDDKKRTDDLALADLWSKKAMDFRRKHESALIAPKPQ